MRKVSSTVKNVSFPVSNKKLHEGTFLEVRERTNPARLLTLPSLMKLAEIVQYVRLEKERRDFSEKSH